MKKRWLVRCAASMLALILIFSLVTIGYSDKLRVTLKNVSTAKYLTEILNAFDTEIDDIRAYLTTDDYVLSDPNLTYGSSNAAKLKISNCWYMINGVMYYLASAETSPVDTIPQNKYGAWALEVGVNGTIDEIGAAANTTGYATAALAIAGLPAVQTDHARLGYATVIHTGADFVGGTTEWTTAGVTDVYVDLLPTAKLGSDLVEQGK